MRAANSAGKRTRWRQTLRRMLAPMAGRGACSCCRLPAKHTQWVVLDLSFIVNHRQPVSIFMERAVAFRALPNDLQASVLDGEPCAQTGGAGKSDIAVRGVAFRAGNASGAASNGPAKPVPVWPVCGLMAAAAMGAHAATFRLSAGRLARSLPPVISSAWYCRPPGTPVFAHSQTLAGLTPRRRATSACEPNSSMRSCSVIARILGPPKSKRNTFFARRLGKPKKVLAFHLWKP